MIELTETQMLQVLTLLRARFGSLQVAHVMLARSAGAVESVNGLAKIVGCSRATVRLCLAKGAAAMAETDTHRINNY